MTTTTSHRLTGISAGSFSQISTYGEPCLRPEECVTDGRFVPGEYVATDSLAYPMASNADWTYSYDSAGRLARAEIGSGSIAYTYAPDGALLTVISSLSGIENRAFVRNSGSYLTTFAMTGPDVSYDGEDTGRIVGYGDWTLSYDPRGRLAKATDGNVVARYDYDADGMRSFKRVVDTSTGTATATRFVYDGTNLVAERIQHYGKSGGAWLASSTEERRYIWLGLRPAAMLQSVDDGAWAYYDIISDRIGRPVVVQTGGGVVVWQTKYSPYGIILQTTGSLAGEFHLRAPGQYEDVETGFYYNGLRYYIPEMRRYNRPEPIGQAGSLDLYMYAGGNPVNRIDPTGLEPWDIKSLFQ